MDSPRPNFILKSVSPEYPETERRREKESRDRCSSVKLSLPCIKLDATCCCTPHVLVARRGRSGGLYELAPLQKGVHLAGGCLCPFKVSHQSLTPPVRPHSSLESRSPLAPIPARRIVKCTGRPRPRPTAHLPVSAARPSALGALDGWRRFLLHPPV